MLELPKQLPDVEFLLGLAPEELAGRLLFMFQKGQRQEPKFMITLREVTSAAFTTNRNDGVTPYPTAGRDKISQALAEAWSWLDAQGLIIQVQGQSENFRTLSRRATAFVDERDLTDYIIARRLPKEALNPRLANTVWQAFMRGEYDVAVFLAMKAVEVAAREASRLPDTLVGVRLMRAAFALKTGPLTDMSVDEGENVARMELFAGAIGSYKNPHSHRDIPINDAGEAIEIIMLANHLLRIVEARLTAQNKQ